MKCFVVLVALAVLSHDGVTAAANARGVDVQKTNDLNLRTLRRANVMSGSTTPSSGRQRHQVNVNYVSRCNGAGGTLTASIKNRTGRPVRSVRVRLVITEAKQPPMRQQRQVARTNPRGVVTFRVAAGDEGVENRSSRCILQIRIPNLPHTVQRVSCSEAFQSRTTKSAECPPANVGSSANDKPATSPAASDFVTTPSEPPPTMAPTKSSSPATSAWDDADDSSVADGAAENISNDDGAVVEDDSTVALAPSPAPTPRGTTPSVGAAAAALVDDDDAARYDDQANRMAGTEPPTGGGADDDYDDDILSYDDDAAASPSFAPSDYQ